MKGDDVAILCDEIERNAYFLGRVIEQNFIPFALCHLGDQRAYVADTDYSDCRRRIEN